MTLLGAFAVICGSLFLLAFGVACLLRPESVLMIEARWRYTGTEAIRPRPSQVSVARATGVLSIGMGSLFLLFGYGMV